MYLFGPVNHRNHSANKSDKSLQHYIQILKNPKFLGGTFSITLGTTPVLFWISQAPNLILYKLHLGYFHLLFTNY